MLLLAAVSAGGWMLGEHAIAEWMKSRPAAHDATRSGMQTGGHGAGFPVSAAYDGARHERVRGGHGAGVSEPSADDAARIQPYAENPRFWQVRGQPVLLLGGTDDDNLFQWTGRRLTDQLDLLVASGGNYIRNTMSARDSGNVQPFRRREGGGYDLDAWNEGYWNRFAALLEETEKRGIIVQIEIWAFHDFTREDWLANPWNPMNNVSYSAEETHLEEHDYGDYWTVRHDFFYTVPALHDDRKVLAYQQRFVDKLLSISLEHGNVLYCMTNEIFTQYSPEWGWYWGRYVRRRAEEANKNMTVAVAEMYQNHDVDHEQHRATLDHPELFDFIDISQNSRKLDQEHWDRLQWVRQYTAEHPRPINHTKTYGGDAVEWTDGDAHGIERFWRNILGGAASTRFHRPPSGIGLSAKAQAHLKSARMFADAFDVFRAEPDVESRRLTDRSPDEAYLSVVADSQYAVYFPAGGAVGLDLSDTPGSWSVQWLDVERCRWSEAEAVQGGREVPLDATGEDNRVVLLTRM